MVFFQTLMIASILQVAYTELSYPRDTGLTPTQLIKANGYPVKRYCIETDDGYILEVLRIPHGLGDPQIKDKPPLLFFHGIFSSAADFVNSFFPIWDMTSGWQMPENFGNLVSNKNGQKKIFYIGHSQGATVAYILNLMRPEYNDKFRLIVSLAPLAYMQNLFNPFLQMLSRANEEVESLLRSMDHYEVFRHTGNYRYVVYCADGSKTQKQCITYYAAVSGYNAEQMNKTRLPVFLTNAPGGASYKQVVHFLQLIQSGHFREYNHSPDFNLKIYKDEVPPDCDLNEVTTPVAILYSEADWLTADLEQLYKEPGNPVLFYKVDDPNFSHLDFIWATDIIPLVYKKVIEIMK